MTIKLRALAVILFFMSPASNADVVYGGDGCPEGSAHVREDGDGAIYLVLDNYRADLKNEMFARRACNIAISFVVPAGTSASFGNVRLHGVHDVGSNVSTSIDIETFFAGSNNPIYSTTLMGEGSINISFTPQSTWTPCGASTIMRLNSSMVIRARQPTHGDAHVAIDEIIIGKPHFRRCS